MIKQKTHRFINENPLFLNFIYILIFLNVSMLIVASYKDLFNQYVEWFEYFEVFTVVIFSIEYLLRLWTADLEFTGKNGIVKKLKFVFSFYGLIDLFAVLPFYLPLFFAFDLRILRILRLFRLLRILKLGRLSKSLQTITAVLKESKSELGITVFVAFILMILSSTLMYYVENEVQPEKFENIGQAMWWSVATLTTVGYGDIYPITGLGKILSSIIALVGIGFVALPTGIISSAFINRMQTQKEAAKECACPNCGTKFKA